MDRDQSRTGVESEKGTGGIRISKKAEADFQTALEKLKLSPDNDLSYILLINRGMASDSSAVRPDQAAADFLEAIRIKKDPNAHADLAHVCEKGAGQDR